MILRAPSAKRAMKLIAHYELLMNGVLSNNYKKSSTGTAEMDVRSVLTPAVHQLNNSRTYFVPRTTFPQSLSLKELS
jgi:hypothetical protein